MAKYALYRRVNLLRENEIAWQIDLLGPDRKVFSASSYKKPMGLKAFAAEVAAENRISGRRIRSWSMLTTIDAPAFVPENRYIDEPVTSRQLVAFWETYDKAIRANVA